MREPDYGDRRGGTNSHVFFLFPKNKLIKNAELGSKDAAIIVTYNEKKVILFISVCLTTGTPARAHRKLRKKDDHVQSKKSKNENWYEKISDYDDADARDEHWWLG